MPRLPEASAMRLKRFAAKLHAGIRKEINNFRVPACSFAAKFFRFTLWAGASSTAKFKLRRCDNRDDVGILTDGLVFRQVDGAITAFFGFAVGRRRFVDAKPFLLENGLIMYEFDAN
jgi:hypothetical protein